MEDMAGILGACDNLRRWQGEHKMTTYNGPTPTVVNRAVNANVHQNQTLSYKFRVVEHLNDDGKVIAYIMQTQVWAHDPPDAIGLKPMPILVQDWTDVPRVQMKDGIILPPAQATKKSPPPFGEATLQSTVQKLTNNGSAGSWAVNPTTFAKDNMEAIVQLLDEDNGYEYYDNAVIRKTKEKHDD